jgi:hypothetical protein
LNFLPEPQGQGAFRGVPAQGEGTADAALAAGAAAGSWRLSTIGRGGGAAMSPGRSTFNST